MTAGVNLRGFAPIMAILRGLRPPEAPEIGAALVEAGIEILEVPLNSPEPLQSIASLVERYGERCLIGAGTVLAARDVDAVADAGGRLIVAPDCNPAVIRHAIARDLVMMPGIASPTEAFRAIDAGARRLKLFPAVSLGAGYLKALADVLGQQPCDATLLRRSGGRAARRIYVACAAAVNVR